MPDSTLPPARQPASQIGIMSMFLEGVHLVQDGHYEKARQLAQAIDTDLKQLLIEAVREAAFKLTFD